MKQRLTTILKSIISIMICIPILSCQGTKAPESKRDQIKNTMHRALSWVYGHPANFIDGMFIEISEEIITFYILSKHAKDANNKKKYIREIEKRIELIASKKDFTVKSQEYTMLLAVASIAEQLDITIFDFRNIIEKELLTNPLLYPPHITTLIWNTVYLERLGYSPPKALDEIMLQSTLYKEAHQKLAFTHMGSQFDPMYIDPISITLYDITHEIFALTDFGALPSPPLIVNNSAFYAQLFNRAIEWSMSIKHIDVLAELIMCVKLLDLKDVPALQSGVNFIVEHQEKDSTFGVTNPSRPNVYRHGILVSIMALSMVEDQF